jgi:hypothetical protein
MSNRYGSVLRSFTIRNIYEAVLTTGTDIVIPQNQLNRTVSDFSYNTHQETNFIARKIGIFSNFADGLVWKNPADRADLTTDFLVFEYADSYTVNVTYGSRAITASAAVWPALTNISIAIDLPNNLTGVFIISTATTSTGTLEDYWSYPTNPNLAARNLTQIGAFETWTMKNLSLLNCMYEYNEFAQPFVIGQGNSYDIIAMRVALNADTNHTTTFMTNTIDSSYDSEKVYFDIVTEIEFTRAP